MEGAGKFFDYRRTKNECEAIEVKENPYIVINYIH